MLDATERHVELQTLLKTPVLGKEQAMVVSGGPGAGKSRILSAAHSFSSHKTYLISANPNESTWPLSGFSAIAELVHVALGQSEDTIENMSPEGGQPALEPYLVAAEFVKQLRREKREPCTIFVDDFELLDQPSRVCLSVAARRLAGTGLWLVFGVDDTASESVTGALNGLPQLKLQPLSFHKALNIVRAAAHDGADPAVLRLVVASGSGNPGSLLNAVKSLTVGQIEGQEPLVLPLAAEAEVNAGFARFLSELAPEQRNLLDIFSASCLVSWPSIKAMQTNSADAVGELMSARIVNMGEPQSGMLGIADSRLRSYIYRQLEPDQRRNIHQQLSRAPQAKITGFNIWHRSYQAETEFPAQALFEFAVELVKGGCLEFATEVLERTLILAGATSEMSEGLLKVSGAFLLRGELSAAGRYLRFSGTESPLPEQAVAQATLEIHIRYLSAQRLDSDKLAQLVAATGETASENAVIGLSVAASYHCERAELREAGSLLSQARGLLASVSQQAKAVYHRACILLQAADGVSNAALTEYQKFVTGTLARSSTADLVILGRSLALGEHHQKARKLFALLLERNGKLEPLWRQAALICAAENEISAGAYSQAMAHLTILNQEFVQTEAFPVQRAILNSWHHQQVGGTRSPAMGQLPSGVVFDDSVPNFTARRYAMSGEQALMEGEFPKAVWRLRRAMTLVKSANIAPLFRGAENLVEALVLTGEMGEARIVAEELENSLKKTPSPREKMVLARVKALVAPPEKESRAFQTAVRAGTLADNHFEKARTLLAYGRILANAGAVNEARKNLGLAMFLFQEVGATSWARCAHEQLERIENSAALPSPWNSLLDRLTPDEREVSIRAVAGMKNKEIAAELYISVRTVEVRLTKVYRKIGARSRAHLATLLITPVAS